MKQVQVWFQVWFQVWLGSDVQGLDIRVGVTVGHWERFRQLGQGEIISSPCRQTCEAAVQNFDR